MHAEQSVWRFTTSSCCGNRLEMMSWAEHWSHKAPQWRDVSSQRWIVWLPDHCCSVPLCPTAIVLSSRLTFIEMVHVITKSCILCVYFLLSCFLIPIFGMKPVWRDWVFADRLTGFFEMMTAKQQRKNLSVVLFNRPYGDTNRKCLVSVRLCSHHAKS